MGTNVWYLAEDNESSYTDFTQSNYIEFNQVCGSKPVKKKVVRKAAVKKAKVSCRKKRRSSAGKVMLCLLAVFAVIGGSVAGAWYYSENHLEDIIYTGTRTVRADSVSDDDEDSSDEHKKSSDRSLAKYDDGISYSKSDPAYALAEDVMASLWCDNDVDTAYEIFNWVHSNIVYQTVTTDMSFEDAAYRGFTRRCGDCYVYFACAKMLLDVAGIPNLMVERYPVVTNGHYWNLVELDGEWYHCDATVFRDHPDMYFMCTDAEIADEHHEFDSDLYPRRAR